MDDTETGTVASAAASGADEPKRMAIICWSNDLDRDPLQHLNQPAGRNRLELCGALGGIRELAGCVVGQREICRLVIGCFGHC